MNLLPPETGGSYNGASNELSFGKPRRLESVFQKYEPPLYFATLCANNRAKLLATPEVHSAFRQYAFAGEQRDIAVGRYVIMPDHLHLLVRGSCAFVLGRWVAGLKRVVAAAVSGGRGMWQRGFFDHLIRHSESYGEKWNYVRNNPVRAGFVSDADDWPFEGEIVVIYHS